MVFRAPSSPSSTDSDTESGEKSITLVLKLDLDRRPSGKMKRKAMRVLSGSHLGAAFDPQWTFKRKAMKALAGLHLAADAICFDGKKNTCTLVGHIDPVGVVHKLRKNCHVEIFSVGPATARNDPFPATVRITKRQPIEDADLERKRSLGILRSEEQLEQSEKQQEDQPPPGQADSYISQVEASPLSHPLPPLSLPLASEARPSSTPVSRSSQGTFPFAPSSSCMFWTESLADMPAHSSISGGACLPKDIKLMEEKGLEAHDQLYDSAVHHLLSGIHGIDELKRRYDLCAGEQANRLKAAEDTAIMLRKQVKELEAKLSMANVPERLMDMVCTSEDRHARTEGELDLMPERLMDMVYTSEDRHARTERELDLVREKMNEVNCRIEYLEAADSNTRTGGERASRASVEGATMSTTRPSPPAPGSTSLSFVPLLLLVLFSQTWRCARKALFFLDGTSYLDFLK